MATRTSAQSGLASATTTWVGGVVPIEGDKVIIASGHVITIDGIYTWGDDTVSSTMGSAAINVSGTIKASRTANSSLTAKGSILFDPSTQAALDYGTIASPIPSPYKASLILNKATTAAQREGMRSIVPTAAGHSISWTFCGDQTRTRAVLLASNTVVGQATLTLANSTHGWVAGDTVIIAGSPTGSTTTQNQEIKTILSVSGSVITFTTNFAYVHVAGIPITNFTSNVTVSSYFSVSGQTATLWFGSTNGNYSQVLLATDTAFVNLGAGSNVGQFNMNYTYYGNKIIFNKCAFYQTINQPCPVVYAGAKAVFQMTNSVSNCSLGGYNNDQNVGMTVDNCVIHNVLASGYNLSPQSAITNSWIEALLASGPALASGGSYTNCKVIGTAILYMGYNGSSMYNCDFGSTYPVTSFYGDQWVRFAGAQNTELSWYFQDCKFGSQWQNPGNPSDLAIQMGCNFVYVNKNQNVTSQEIWTHLGTVIRNNTTTKRGTSSVAITTHKITSILGRPQTKTLSIPCANGQSIRIVGYVQADTSFYNGGSWTPPTVTLSGLNATPVSYTATSASSGAWEKYDLSITNTAGYDGSFILTYSVASLTTVAGTVYFDGVPDSPFVTKVRHYGFDLTQSSLPNRTIDPYVVATEATASAYTGMTINGATNRISFGSGTITTAQQMYDYSRYWACTNLTYDIPFNRSGTLLSLATGWTVADPTILGVTWSGGTIEFNSNGTKLGGFDTNTFNIKATGSYDFSQAGISGNITLLNSSGGAVSVILPVGVTYTNTLANITVTYPTNQATFALTGLEIGSEVDIYKASDGSLLAAIETTTGTTFSYTYTYSTDIPIIVVIFALDAQPIFLNATLTATGTTIPIQQNIDRVYST